MERLKRQINKLQEIKTITDNRYRNEANNFSLRFFSILSHWNSAMPHVCGCGKSYL